MGLRAECKGWVPMVATYTTQMVNVAMRLNMWVGVSRHPDPDIPIIKFPFILYVIYCENR